MKKRVLWAGLAALAVAGAAGGWAARLVRVRQVVAQFQPPPPALADRPAVMGESIAEADARARTLRHARDGLVALSQLYHANGFYPEALGCYDGLRTLEPGNPRWPHLEAGILASFGRLDEALPLRERAVTLAPAYVPARLRLGDILLKANRDADAAKTYGDVLQRAPGDPYALLGLARCALVNHDWNRARDFLQQAIAQHPGFIGALSLLVTVSEQLGDQAAADSYKAAMGSGIFTDLPDPWLDELSDACFDGYLLSVAASTANYAGNRPAALALIDRAIGLSSNPNTYRRQAAGFLIQDKNFGAARAQLEQVIAADPSDSDSWLRYLETLRGLGDTATYPAAILRGLSSCPQSSGLHLEYARWLKSANRLSEAIGEFRYAYQLRPTEVDALIELAATYVTVGRSQDAIAVLNLALERQPDHPIALATLALVAISQGDEAEARRRWAQLLQQTRTPAEVRIRVQQAFQQQFGRDL